MAIIPGNKDYINDVEVAANAPHSELLMNKIGADINFILDSGFKVKKFESPGTGQTLSVPSDVGYVIVLGAGGGGAGGGAAFNGGGGGGGAGSNPVWVYSTVSPSSSITLDVGGGGAIGVGGISSGPVNGTAGGNGAQSRFDTTGVIKVFPGGGGGAGGTNGALGAGASGSFTISTQSTFGGPGGYSAVSSQPGEGNYFAAGGAFGLTVTYPGGGGGGAGLGNGGAGGLAPNGNGGNGGISAGGGGGASGIPGLPFNVGDGGLGGNGFIYVFYYSGFTA